MNLSDLLVSYKQVKRPSYLDNSDINIQPIENSFGNTTQQAYDRIAERQKKEGFMGWNLPINDMGNTQSTENNQTLKPIKGTATFEKAMDSYLSKHPEDSHLRYTLTRIAKVESNFNPTVKNSASSASGYFQFINSTRKQYAPNLTREQFLSNPEAQIEAAAKLLKANRRTSGKFSNLRGLSQLQVDYGMWFSPAALTNYLKTGTSNFKDAQGTSLMTVLRKMA